MGQLGEYTRDEILSQPEAWAATLQALRPHTDATADVFRRGQYQAVVFTGCGSTYYLSLAAAAVLRELSGVASWGVPASEIWLRPREALPRNLRTLLVAVSRSGKTTETVRACQSFLGNHPRSDLVTLSCYPDCPLSVLGGLNLILPAGQERSVAQTRAFTCLYLATVVAAALWAETPELVEQLTGLAPIARRLLDHEAERARQLGREAGLDRFYFLGSGLLYGLACELSLKMKEMSLSHSEPFHFLEFSHGPQSMVAQGTMIVGLVSDASTTEEGDVLAQVCHQGASILSIGETGGDVSFTSGLAQTIRGVLYLPVGQLLALERAISRGLDPDRPHNLSAVVTLDTH